MEFFKVPGLYAPDVSSGTKVPQGDYSFLGTKGLGYEKSIIPSLIGKHNLLRCFSLPSQLSFTATQRQTTADLMTVYRPHVTPTRVKQHVMLSYQPRLIARSNAGNVTVVQYLFLFSPFLLCFSTIPARKKHAY